MDIDSDSLGIPDTDYDARVIMSSAEFARIVRDLSQLGESVRIDISKEGVRFASDGEAANGSVLLKGKGPIGKVSGGPVTGNGKGEEGSGDGEDEDVKPEIVEDGEDDDEDGESKKKKKVKKEKTDGDVDMDADKDEEYDEDGEPEVDEDDEDEEDGDSKKRKKKVRFLSCFIGLIYSDVLLYRPTVPQNPPKSPRRPKARESVNLGMTTTRSRLIQSSSR
jgi:proliferating cell nuclear antigen